MLSAEAMRLAAVEVLCPTAAIVAGSGYPTLAGRNVLDSRAVALQDLDPAASFTPVLSLYTSDSRVAVRDAAADQGDSDCQATLEIVAELAVRATDGDGDYADALAADDPDARLVLSALTSQVRFMLFESEAGFLFRSAIIALRQITEETFAAPQLGIRWQRVTMKLVCAIPDDRFDIGEGGLPEPVRSLAGMLPAGSYARDKLDALAARFAADPRSSLDLITINRPGLSADAPPVSSVDLTE